MSNNNSSKGKLLLSLLVTIYTFNFAIASDSTEDKRLMLADLDTLFKACEKFDPPDFDRLNVEKLKTSLKKIWSFPPIIDKVETRANKTKDPYIRINLLVSLEAAKVTCYTKFAFSALKAMEMAPLNRKETAYEQAIEVSNKNLLNPGSAELSTHILFLQILSNKKILSLNEIEFNQLKIISNELKKKTIEKMDKIKKLTTNKSLSNAVLDRLNSEERIYITTLLNKNQDFLRKLSKKTMRF